MRNWEDIGADEFVTIEEFVNRYPWCFTFHNVVNGRYQVGTADDDIRNTGNGKEKPVWNSKILFDDYKNETKRKDFIQPRHIENLAWIDVSSVFHHIDEIYDWQYGQTEEQLRYYQGIPRNKENYLNENVPKKFLEFYDVPSYLWVETKRDNERVRLHQSYKFAFLSVKIESGYCTNADGEQIEGETGINFGEELQTTFRVGPNEIRNFEYNTTGNSPELWFTFPKRGKYRIRYVHSGNIDSTYLDWNRYNLFNSPNIIEVEDNFFNMGHEFYNRHYRVWNTFEGCVNLRKVGNIFGKYAKLSVQHIRSIFQDCHALREIDLAIFRDMFALEHLAHPFYRMGFNDYENTIPFDNYFVRHIVKNCPNLREANIFYSANISFKLYEEMFETNPNLEVVQGCFVSNWTGEIPENLFANNPKLKNVAYCFFGLQGIGYPAGESIGTRFCQKPKLQITSIPENLFANNPMIEDVRGLFANNTGTVIPNLQRIPENLFASFDGNLRYINHLFFNSNITNIPKVFKRENPRLDTIDAVFGYSSGDGNPPETMIGIQTIPDDFFDVFPNVIYFNRIFQHNNRFPMRDYRVYYQNLVKIQTMEYPFENTSIREIYENTFDTLPDLRKILGVFKNCKLLNHMIPRFFKPSIHTRLNWIEYLLEGAGTEHTTNLAIPERFFADLPELRVCRLNFKNSGIRTVGKHMWENCVKIEYVTSNFENTTYLDWIDLFEFFKNCPRLNSTEQAFYRCQTKAYRNFENVFDGIGSQLTNAERMFQENLFVNHRIDITKRLFRDVFNTITYISWMFEWMQSKSHRDGDVHKANPNPDVILTIEEGLFENAPKLRKCEATFSLCLNLIEIPPRVFKNCTKVETFKRCFSAATYSWNGEEVHNIDSAKCTRIGQAVFNGCTNNMYIRSAFAGLRNVSSIDFGTLDNPETHMFGGNTKIRDASGCFENVGRNHTGEPNVVLDARVLNVATHSSIIWVTRMFSDCNLISEVVDRFFENFVNMIEAYGVFNRTKNCSRFGNQIFKGCVKLINARFSLACTNYSWNGYAHTDISDGRCEYIGYGQFNGCSELKYLRGAFAGHKNCRVLDFNGFQHETDTYMFGGCVKLEDIEQLSQHVGINYLRDLQYQVNQRSREFILPTRLFDDCRTKINIIHRAFEGNLTIGLIQHGIFQNCIALTTTTRTFFNLCRCSGFGNNLYKGCTKLTVAEETFAIDPSQTSFTTERRFGYGIFSGCVKLKQLTQTFRFNKMCSIFDFNGDGIAENHIFYNCNEITHFPYTFESLGKDVQFNADKPMYVIPSNLLIYRKRNGIGTYRNLFNDMRHEMIEVQLDTNGTPIHELPETKRLHPDNKRMYPYRFNKGGVTSEFTS